MKHSRKQRRFPTWLANPLVISLFISGTIWIHLLVSQFMDFTNKFETKPISPVGQTQIRHIYNATSKALQPVGGGGDGNPLAGLLEATPQQLLQRQKAARENQAWLAKKYAHAHVNVVAPSRNASQSHQSHLDDSQSGPSKQEDSDKSLNAFSSIFKLPDWLAADAQNQVRLEEDVESDAIHGPCKTFNHTILRPPHGCQINRDTLQLFCVFSNLRVDNTLIQMDRGGERLEDVMGRAEYKEFPEYSKGAFRTDRKPTFKVPKQYRGANNLHYLQDVLNNLQYPTSKNKGEFNSTCVETRKGTTLLLTRYEYVNLYHTLTDWWNAFFVLTPEQRSRKEKIRVLFLDGHAQGNLDPVWSEVYGPFEFVQHLTPGGVCLERAVLVPPGYMAPIFPDTGNQNADREPRIRCPRPILMERFCNFFLTAFGLEQLKLIPGKIVIIDRQPYISHPRSRGGRIARVLEGLDDLKERLLKIRGVTGVEVVRFEGLPVREQVRIVREAHILIGNHGAGLTHLAFMDPNAHVLEFTVGYLEFFDYLAAWKGIHHRSIGISDEDRLSGRDVLYTIETVEGMLSGSST